MAINEEIEEFLNRNSWDIVSKHSLTASANILGGRFIQTLTDEGALNEFWKARFVVQGHNDSMKSSTVDNIAAARQFSIKTTISVASIKRLRLFSLKVNHKNNQSGEDLQREVLVNKCKEFGLEDG